MFRPRFSRAFAFASIAAIAAGSMPAEAQQIDRIVAFGDSYTDTGNAFALGYANPQALAIYPTRRFSSGTNYIDTLASILRVPVEDFAIGGAFGGSNNGTLCFDPFYAPGTSPLCGKGLQYEVDQFLNVGAQSGVFPNASTTLTRNDLVAVSIGGNDARFYQQAGGTLAGAPTAGAAAGTATTLQLDRLVAQGNPTISFLALNGAVAPEVAGNPSAQAIRGAYSTAYFTAMQPALARYAAGGSIVHYLDGQLLLNNVAANPAAFGVTNGLVCPIFPDPTCLVNANGYLFYGDALHLTSQGYALVARYVAAQLAAPLTLQAPSDLGLDTAQQWGRTLSSRTGLYGSQVKDGLHLFVLGDAFSRQLGRTQEHSAFDITGAGGTIGAEYGLGGSALVGIAGNYSRPRVRFGNDSARINSRSWQIGAYGSMSMGGLFGQAYLGYGKDRHDITRAGVVEAMSATPHGNHTTAGAKGGYLMSLGGLQLGPLVEIDYARARVDGYTERGDAALTLNVGGQHLKSLAGQAGLEARGELAGLHPFIDLAAEHVFSANDRLISFSQTSAPMIVNSWSVGGQKETYGRVTTGATANVGGPVSVDVEISTTIGRNGGQQLGGQLGVKASF